MRSRFPIVLAVLLAVAGCTACGSAPPPSPSTPTPPGGGVVPPGQPGGPDGPAAELVDPGNRFAIDLFGHLRRSERGNFAFSPASVSLALSMTWAGARGETADQMARTLHIDAVPGDVHAGYGSLLAGWNDPSRTDYELRVANRLFGERTANFHADFLSLTGDRYGAPLEPVDFIGNPDGSRRRVNAWVAEQTRDRIRDLLPPGSVDDMARLILTNAIYFKGRWLREFDEEATRAATFQRLDRSTVEVPTMYQTGEFGYAEVDGVHVLEMPYVGGDLSMLVLLPATQDGLPALEQRLTADALAGYAAAVRTQEVDVALPRFRIDPPEPMALTEILPQLGMSLPFSPAADFSGMADIRPLYIQDVFHKAFVEVNEEGTEAAAATAVVVRTESASMNPSFSADHPFLFVIRDRRTGFVLFMGRVADPSA